MPLLPWLLLQALRTPGVRHCPREIRPVPPLSLDGSYNLSGNQPIQTLLFVSSMCREGNCGAHDLEEEVVVTVKVQLYRTSEIVVSRWLGVWSMALMLWLPCY